MASSTRARTRPAAASRSFGDVETVAVGGTVLAYREQGHGDPVVFVHGSASDLRTWQHQLPALGSSHRAIAYSRRYARPNDDIPPGVDDQMLPHVRDLVDFLRAVDAAPAHLVGNSWGAFICLLTAIRHPDMVRTLVLEEPPVLSLFVSTPPRPGEMLRLLARRPATALAIARFGAGTLAPAQKAFRRGDEDQAIRTFASGVLGTESYARLPEERKQQMRDNGAALSAQLLGAGFPPLSPGEVRGVKTPTLLLTGQRSPAVLRRLSEHLHELLPNVEAVEIAGASHAMHEQEPTAVNQAIHRFLSMSPRDGPSCPSGYSRAALARRLTLFCGGSGAGGGPAG